MSAGDDKREGSRGGAEASGPVRLLAGCQAAIRREMPGLLVELFSKVDDALYEAADKSDNNSLYTTYFDAMRVFRRQREDIKARFLARLEEAGEVAMKSPVAGRAEPAAAAQAEGYALVEHAELEESLAVANLISKAENRYKALLAELRRHHAALLGRESIDSRNDPIGPHAICHAFQAALDPVKVDLAVKLVVFKLFDKQVMDQLGDLYAHCLECASSLGGEKRGAVPSFIQREGNTPRRVVGTRSAAEAVPDVGPSGGMRLGQGVAAAFEDLQRMLRERLPRRNVREDEVVVDSNELMSALCRLQIGSDMPIDISPRELRLRLGAELRLQQSAVGGRALDASDEDTLDLVFLLFESILQGNDLPDAFKALIGRLQIPIVKVALSDKSFFDDPEHPARRLLNHMAEAAVGWIDDGDRSAGSLYSRIEAVVARVLTDYDRDPTIFAQLDADLVSELAREHEQAETWESQAQHELEGRERNRGARERVDQAVEEGLAQYPVVPEVVSSLLRQGWREVMLAAFLRGGVGGGEWQDALATMDRLLWSVQPKLRYEERRELLRGIPELLRNLRESLAGVSFDQRRLARWFRELQALHISALRGSGQPPADMASSPAVGSAGQNEAAITPIKGVAARRFAVARAESVPAWAQMALGTWVEIRQDDGGVLRVKLAWRSPDTDVYLFVDRRGRKALELSGTLLAALSDSGRITRLVGTESPLVDRAMEVLLQSLQVR